MGKTVHAYAESGLGLSGDVTWDLTLSRPMEERINQLAEEIHGTREDVFKKAIALLALAVKAKHDGMKLAVVDSEGNIDTEITGF